MTDQELFNIVATHLLTQNARSLGGTTEDICAYRGDNGLKCAVGVLISDKYYEEKFEGLPCSAGVVLKALELSLGFLTADQIDLLTRLQIIHDRKLVKDWESYLEELAYEYELDMPEVPVHV